MFLIFQNRGRAPIVGCVAPTTREDLRPVVEKGPGVLLSSLGDDRSHEFWEDGLVRDRVGASSGDGLPCVMLFRSRRPGESRVVLQEHERRTRAVHPDTPGPDLPSTYIVTCVPKPLRDDAGRFCEFAGKRLLWNDH